MQTHPHGRKPWKIKTIEDGMVLKAQVPFSVRLPTASQNDRPLDRAPRRLSCLLNLGLPTPEGGSNDYIGALKQFLHDQGRIFMSTSLGKIRLADSIWSADKPAGTILEQSPKPSIVTKMDLNADVDISSLSGVGTVTTPPYLVQRKEEILEVEDPQNAVFDKRLSQEEIWIRQGIEARRTRNEGRVRALESMRRESADHCKQLGTARMDIQQEERSVIVSKASNISSAFEGGDSSDQLGELSPQSQGNIKTGTNLSVVYFGQYRSALDEEKAIQDSVSGGRDMLDIGGKPRHVISYLKDFQFAPDRCRQPVKALSIGLNLISS